MRVLQIKKIDLDCARPDKTMNFLPQELDDYVVSHSQSEPKLLQELNRETYQKILQPRMLSGHYQGRVLSMISKLVNPENILAVTFTNKAAREMKERVEEVIGGNIAGLWIGTFHSFAARIMRIEGGHLGYKRNFSIYDMDDQVRSIKKVISTLTVPQQIYTPKLIQNRLSKVKNQFLFKYRHKHVTIFPFATILAYLAVRLNFGWKLLGSEVTNLFFNLK